MPARAPKKKSLAFIQFKDEITREIRKFWMKICSLSYAEKYINEMTSSNREERIGSMPEHKNTFLSNLDLTYSQFVEEVASTEEFIRQDSIVNIISIFENYFFNAYKRAIFLNITFQETKGNQGQLIPVAIVETISKSKDPLINFAHYASSRMLRNKSTREMANILCDISKAGTTKEKSDIFNLIQKNALIRNAIVHNSRCVSDDMQACYEEYSAGHRIITTNKNVTSLSTACIRFLEALDTRYCQTIVLSHDAFLLTQELYIVKGLDNGSISHKVYNSLGVKLTRDTINTIIAKIKKEPPIKEFFFSSNILE